jgi:mono/diheme cytochrome c family protein
MRALPLALLLLAAPALAQSPPAAGDAEAGGRIAAQWCANCHRVSAGGPGPATDAVTPFPSLAARPATTADSIAAFLRRPHAGMPDFGLSQADVRDVAAFILAQRPR